MKPCASALLVTLLCIYLGLRPERCDAQCPATLPPTIVNTPCPNQTQLDAIKSQISTQIAAKFNNSTLGGCIQTYGSSRIKPATSCQQILIAYPTSSSGYYWVINSTGVAIQVYCRFDRFTNFTFFGLNSTNGFARVASVNLTSDPSQQCPLSLALTLQSGHRLCEETTGSACDSVTISTLGLRWQSVCGRVAGYEDGVANAFAGTSTSIDSPYVDGVSITYGSPRNHLWSYGIGAFESNQANGHNCPCSSGPAAPAFVGSSWYCESAVPTQSTYSGQKTIVYAMSDLLWDGQMCNSGEAACCLAPYSYQPWFCARLPSSTVTNLEMRLCSSNALTSENVGLEQWEFYVQ